MKERREIPSLEGYYATSDGEIIGPKGEVIKPLDNGSGYKQITVNHSSKRLVHRLIAEAFLKNDEHLTEVNHKNGNRGDNRPDNLEWCSRGYNIHHSYSCLGRTDSRSIKVKNVSTGEVFNSIREAARSVNQGNTNLANSIKRNGTCGGYKWKLMPA